MATSGSRESLECDSTCDFQSQYNQVVKKVCRNKLITHAVRCLTTERDKSVCVQGYHVVNVWKELQETGEVKEYLSLEERRDIASEIEKWQRLHKSRVGIKEPADLRVCYLGGDNPTNDLKVLIENGVLTENVWAIEKDTATFKKGKESVNRYPDFMNVHLIKADIQQFLINFQEKFDIIYYDACGSLPSAKQNTLKFIGTVFLHNKLTSPGALITNFSFPPKQQPAGMPGHRQADDEERNRISFLSREYLKYRLLDTPAVIQDVCESAAAIPCEMTDEDFYSDYITYQVIDSAFLYTPAFRMLTSSMSGSSKSQSLWNQAYVKSSGDFLKEIKLYIRNPSGSQDQRSTSPLYETAIKSFLGQIGITMQQGSKTNGILCQVWETEIFPDWRNLSQLLRKHEDIASMLLTYHLSCSEHFINKFANEHFQTSLKRIKQGCDPDERGGTVARFCDVPDPDGATRLVGGLVYGQLAYPSFPVVDKLLRLRYTAKERQMFSDVFIFDQCRYIFDQFPSVHSAAALLAPKKRMVLQMALDGMRMQLNTISNKYFWNVAVLHKDSFHNIPQRQEIHVLPVLQRINWHLKKLKLDVKHLKEMSTATPCSPEELQILNRIPELQIWLKNYKII